MSKETDMLRKFASRCNENDIPSFLNLHGLRDRVAFAIEAVEAKIAEIVARVEKLEKMGRLGASPNGDDRTRGDMSPRGFDSPTPAAPTPPAPSAVTAPELWHRATQGFASSTLPTDMGQGPAESPAPRGFRVGDVCRVVESWRTKKNRLVGCVGALESYPGGSGGDWVINLGDKHGVRCFYNSELTLVRAADAPEAPAEDAGLVERLARDWDKAESIWLDWATMSADGRTTRCNVVRHMLATLRAESRLCAPGEVARLKARAEAAEKERDEARAISAATVECVRTETQIATELRKELADANGARDRLVRELSGERVERDYWKIRAEDVTKERDGYRGLSESLRAELTAAQGEMRSLRATISVLRADLAALKGQRDAQTRSYDRVAAECDALRLASLTWFNAAGEPELLATAEEVTERRKAAAKELAALRAKPRFRTRKVTAADARALDDEWAKSTYVGRNSWVLAMNALGFRRRVDGAK